MPAPAAPSLPSKLVPYPGRVRHGDVEPRQRVLFYDYRANAALYPAWQERLRATQPKTIIFWGRRRRYCPDQVFFCWWWPVMAADRVIRWTTAVAAVASYEHAYDLVRAHGEAGWTARLVPLTVDGLIYASSMVMVGCARRKVPVPELARWLLGLGITATLAANVAHGLGARPDGCGVGRVAGGRPGRLV